MKADDTDEISTLGQVFESSLRRIVREELLSVLPQTQQPTDDRMLKAKEACEVLGVSQDWLYRHADQLPFTRKLGPGVLRFSSTGIQRWLATKKVVS